MIKLKKLLQQQMAYQNILDFKDENFKGFKGLLSAIANFQNQLKAQRKNFRQNQQYKKQVYATIMNIIKKNVK